jgi:hypothetical protein
MRSTPETVFAKLSRAAVRSFCTPSSSATLMAIAQMVSSAVARRFHKLFKARVTVGSAMASRNLRGGAVDVAHGERAIEKTAERRIVADEQQGSFEGAAFDHQQSEEVRPRVCIQRGSGLIGDEDLRTSNQSAGGGDALLLTD